MPGSAQNVFYRVAFAAGIGAFACAFALGIAQSWTTGGTLPELPFDELGQARSAFEAGDLDTVVRELRTYARLQPQQADGWLRLGDALWTSRDRTGAIAAFERSLTTYPIPVQAYRALAVLYYEDGQIDRALENAQAAEDSGVPLPPALQTALARARDVRRSRP